MPISSGISPTYYRPLTDLSQRSRMESLEQSLARWVTEVPQGERRDEMFHSVLDTYKRDCTQLDLDCQGLTLMPRIPRCVTSLTLSHVSSPEVLARTEFHSDLEGLEIRNSSLTSLPTLPDKIATVLLINCNALTSLQGLPKELKTLYLLGCDGITDFSDLPPGAQCVTLPQTPAIKATPRSGNSPTIRTLAQKVESYNTDPATNLVVSILDPNKVDTFSLDIFQEEFETRRNAFDNNERGRVNFSGSLLNPTGRGKLFWHMPSRINEPFAHQYSYWKDIGLPDNITQQQQDHLNSLQAHLDALWDKYSDKDDLPNIRVAERELGQAWLAVWEGHPEVLYRCSKLFMGFIISDHAKIQHAFPVAGDTYNQRYTTKTHQFDKPKLQVGANRASEPEIVKRDKHFKMGDNGIKEREWNNTLTALSKHTEKHNPTQCTEILFGAPDDNLDHVIDGFFLDMRSGFEAMNLETVDLYLYHNQDIVLANLKNIRGYPLLVNYTDKDSGLHKFAYVTLTPEGIPVATEQLPG